MPYSCEHCAEAPALKDERGCTKPSTAAVWASDQDEWHSCPMLFANQHLYTWLESYRFAEEFGGISYENMPVKWIEAWRYYKLAIARMQKLARRNDDDLDALKGALNGRRT